MIIDLNSQVQLIRPEGKAVFPYSNSLYIKGNPSVLIDAGSGSRAYSEIKDRVDIVLLTHNHFDHINGVSLFPKAAIWASRLEAPGYSDPAEFASYAGFQRWEELMGRPRTNSFAQVNTMPDDIPVRPGFQPIDLQGMLDDGIVFDTGQERIVAIHTPGHSHGHCSFWLEKSGILFSADIDLSPYGPWYGGEYSDFNQFEASVYRLIEMKPAILATSHRRIFHKDKENIAGLLSNYLNIALQKERHILDYLKKPCTFMNIAEQEFLNTYPARTEYTRFWTRMMLLKHLQRLEGKGLIRRQGDEPWYEINN